MGSGRQLIATVRQPGLQVGMRSSLTRHHHGTIRCIQQRAVIGGIAESEHVRIRDALMMLEGLQGVVSP